MTKQELIRNIKQSCQEIFKQSKIEESTDFLELGVDSLLLIQLRSDIKKKINIDLTVQEIFQNPTVYNLATYIDNAK